MRLSLVLIFSLLFSGVVFAQESSSATYQMETSGVVGLSGYSSSSTYILTDFIDSISVGTSTAATYGANLGFLHFPFVNTPVVTATPGANQVALSWTAATGVLGWTVSSYNVGQSTTSGGPYSYTDLSSVTTSSTRSGLTAGVTYYFVIRPQDAFGNSIATSSEVSAIPTAPSPPPPPPPPAPSPSPGGGGGGGGYVAPSGATAVFSGLAYPRSEVTLLKDAQVVASTIAGSDATFSITVSNLNAGNFIFSLYSEDSQGRSSRLLTFPVSLTAGATTNITGIFLAPTIAVDKSEVKKGDNIAVFGQSVTQSEITISVSSDEEYFVKTNADTNGVYLYNFDTSVLDYGSHATKSKSAKSGLISSFSSAVSFKVGTQNVAAVPTVNARPVKGDVNGDGRVNLVDFSIVAYWWYRPLTQAAKDQVDAKLWPDGSITLRDFSILAYYWTG